MFWGHDYNVWYYQCWPLSYPIGTEQKKAITLLYLLESSPTCCRICERQLRISSISLLLSTLSLRHDYSLLRWSRDALHKLSSGNKYFLLYGFEYIQYIKLSFFEYKISISDHHTVKLIEVDLSKYCCLWCSMKIIHLSITINICLQHHLL